MAVRPVATMTTSLTLIGVEAIVKVDDGKTMDYVIAPVIGGDGRSPLVHANTHSPITSTFLQGRSAEPTVYNDGARSFEIAAGRNGYFNGRVDTSGSL